MSRAVAGTLAFAILAAACTTALPPCPPPAEQGLGCLAEVVNRLEDAMGITFEYNLLDSVWEGRSSGWIVWISQMHEGPSDEPQGTRSIYVNGQPEGSQIPNGARPIFIVLDELAPGAGSWALESLRNGEVGPSGLTDHFGTARVKVRYGPSPEDETPEFSVWVTFELSANDLRVAQLCVDGTVRRSVTWPVQRSNTGPQWPDGATLALSFATIVQPARSTVSSVTFIDDTIVLPSDWTRQDYPFTSADTWSYGRR